MKMRRLLAVLVAVSMVMSIATMFTFTVGADALIPVERSWGGVNEYEYEIVVRAERSASPITFELLEGDTVKFAPTVATNMNANNGLFNITNNAATRAKIEDMAGVADIAALNFVVSKVGISEGGVQAAPSAMDLTWTVEEEFDLDESSDDEMAEGIVDGFYFTFTGQFANAGAKVFDGFVADDFRMNGWTENPVVEMTFTNNDERTDGMRNNGTLGINAGSSRIWIESVSVVAVEQDIEYDSPTDVERDAANDRMIFTPNFEWFEIPVLLGAETASLEVDLVYEEPTNDDVEYLTEETSFVIFTDLTVYNIATENAGVAFAGITVNEDDKTEVTGTLDLNSSDIYDAIKEFVADGDHNDHFGIYDVVNTTDKSFVVDIPTGILGNRFGEVADVIHLVQVNSETGIIIVETVWDLDDIYTVDLLVEGTPDLSSDKLGGEITLDWGYADEFFYDIEVKVTLDDTIEIGSATNPDLGREPPRTNAIQLIETADDGLFNVEKENPDTGANDADDWKFKVTNASVNGSAKFASNAAPNMNTGQTGAAFLTAAPAEAPANAGRIYRGSYDELTIVFTGKFSGTEAATDGKVVVSELEWAEKLNIIMSDTNPTNFNTGTGAVALEDFEVEIVKVTPTVDPQAMERDVANVTYGPEDNEDNTVAEEGRGVLKVDNSAGFLWEEIATLNGLESASMTFDLHRSARTLTGTALNNAVVYVWSDLTNFGTANSAIFEDHAGSLVQSGATARNRARDAAAKVAYNTIKDRQLVVDIPAEMLIDKDGNTAEEFYAVVISGTGAGTIEDGILGEVDFCNDDDGGDCDVCGNTAAQADIDVCEDTQIVNLYGLALDIKGEPTFPNFDFDPKPECVHTYGSWTITTPATCAAEGARERTCTQTGCGNKDTETIAKTNNHVWTPWAVTTEATCTDEGVETRSCTLDCGVANQTRGVATIPHDISDPVIVAPTCTEDGSETGVCEMCDEEETNVISKLGHDWTEWAPVEGSDPAEESRSCKRDDCEEVETRPVGGPEVCEVCNEDPCVCPPVECDVCGEDPCVCPPVVDKAALVKAVADFEAIIENVQIAENGEKINVLHKWMTQATADMFANALIGWKAIVDDEEATQEAVDAAVAEIAETSKPEELAKVIFYGDMETTDFSKLIAEILDADKAMDKVIVSEDGEDVSENDMWVTQEAMDVFGAAIIIANSVLEDGLATQPEVDAAVAALKDAIAIFVAAQEPGLKVVPTECPDCGKDPCECPKPLPAFAPGDVDNDGRVNIGDVLEVLKFMAKIQNNIIDRGFTRNGHVEPGGPGSRPWVAAMVVTPRTGAVPADRAGIQDVLEMLKALAKIPTPFVQVGPFPPAANEVAQG
jgi:hypothetical protein